MADPPAELPPTVGIELQVMQECLDKLAVLDGPARGRALRWLTGRFRDDFLADRADRIERGEP